MIHRCNKGVFMVSIDTELAWGGVHNGSFRKREQLYRRSRGAIDSLLELMEKYSVQATWAFVGHLFLERCQPEGWIKHPEIVRPSYPWFSGDWFESDPCSNLASNNSWYGRDIVEKVRRCKVPQEIGSHGFCHMIAGSEGCSPASFASDLRACQREALAMDLTLHSFVFPRNSIAHLDVLRNEGFVAYRSVSRRWFTGLPPRIQKPLSFVDYLLASPPVVEPERNDGLWGFPDSYFYGHRVGWAKAVPVGWRVWRANRALLKASRQRAIFHLWFHEFNLASEPHQLLGGLETIFRHFQELRDEGKLDNFTMGDMARRLNCSSRLEGVRL